jgi:membrane protease YdiL (CAAX protease family)
VDAVSSPTGSSPVPWNLSRNGVVAVAALLTLVALAENTLAPWAPFQIVYAALATFLPLGWGTWSFGRLSTVRRSSWALVVFFPVVLQAGVSLWRLLGADSATAAGPLFSLSAALPALYEAAGAHLGCSAERARWLYLAFVALWAGLGEELFYRGYMHGTLRRQIGPLRAAAG